MQGPEPQDPPDRSELAQPGLSLCVEPDRVDQGELPLVPHDRHVPGDPQQRLHPDGAADQEDVGQDLFDGVVGCAGGCAMPESSGSVHPVDVLVVGSVGYAQVLVDVDRHVRRETARPAAAVPRCGRPGVSAAQCGHAFRFAIGRGCSARSDRSVQVEEPGRPGQSARSPEASSRRRVPSGSDPARQKSCLVVRPRRSDHRSRGGPDRRRPSCDLWAVDTPAAAAAVA